MDRRVEVNITPNLELRASSRADERRLFRVLYRIQDPAQIVPGKECRVRIECPNANFPKDIKRAKITILSLALENDSSIIRVHPRSSAFKTQI